MLNTVVDLRLARFWILSTAQAVCVPLLALFSAV